MDKLESAAGSRPSPQSAGDAEPVVASSSALARAAARARNLPMLMKLSLFALAMFGFGWAMVPLYNAICEVTGINTLTKRDEGAAEFARSTQVDTSRTIVIEFDSNSHGPWRFKPERSTLTVHPGELATVVYDLVNTEDRAMAGQAIPSYAPDGSGRFFRKLECFCFEQQALGPGEQRQFPVVFVVDPKLPADVTTITLSYTFFGVGGGAKAASVTPAVPAPAAGAGRS
jgi:cytochrome c oxidase assembly protein subunit 11